MNLHAELLTRLPPFLYEKCENEDTEGALIGLRCDFLGMKQKRAFTFPSRIRHVFIVPFF